jgi:DNA-binding NarL/FixJ family response regulator
VVDLSLPGASGLEVARELRARGIEVPVLILSVHDEAIWGERALRAGAKGYIMKEEAPQTIVDAIRKVLGGGVWVSESMSARILGGMADAAQPTTLMERLSDREMEVYRLIGEGWNMRQIAESLHLSVKTVEAHREHIKAKLALASSLDLVRHATLWAQGEPKS